MRVAASTGVALLLLTLYVFVVSSRPSPASAPQRPNNRRHQHNRHDRNDPEKMAAAVRRREQVWGRLQGRPAECCPTVTTHEVPVLGKSKNNTTFELFRSPNSTQIFEEVSCAKSVANKQCRFVEKHLRKYSQCVQQYSYTYALVREAGSTNPFRLDYISIRSGCSCQIVPPGAEVF